MGKRSSRPRPVSAAGAGEASAPPPAPDRHTVVEHLRARRLAHVQPETAPLSPSLTFVIAGEEYVIPAGRALDVVRCDDVTKVPRTPPWIRGLTTLRGEVLPIIDLAPKMGVGLTPLGSRTCALVV